MEYESLVEMMKEGGVTKVVATASGGGDEGFFDGADYFDEKGEVMNPTNEDQLNDYIEDMMHETGYDYSNNEGGVLTFELDLASGQGSWDLDVYESQLVDSEEDHFEL